jgi:hypothetical protein
MNTDVGSITICCGIYENRERVDRVEYLIQAELVIEKAIDKNECSSNLLATPKARLDASS